MTREREREREGERERERYLSLFQTALDLGLLVLAGKRSVQIVNLGAVLIDVFFESVFAIFRVGNQLVLHKHLVLAFGPQLLGLVVDSGGARDDGEFALLDLLLDLVRLLGLVLGRIRFHSLNGGS